MKTTTADGTWGTSSCPVAPGRTGTPALTSGAARTGSDARRPRGANRFGARPSSGRHTFEPVGPSAPHLASLFAPVRSRLEDRRLR